MMTTAIHLETQESDALRYRAVSGSRQSLGRTANRFKSDFETGFDPVTEQEVALFLPREQSWSAHFRIEVETALLIGLTPKGRATIARLKMNRPQQLRAPLKSASPPHRAWVS